MGINLAFGKRALSFFGANAFLHKGAKTIVQHCRHVRLNAVASTITFPIFSRKST